MNHALLAEFSSAALGMVEFSGSVSSLFYRVFIAVLNQ